MSSNECTCGELDISVGDFEGYEDPEKVKTGFRVLPGLYFKRRDYSKIVRIATIFPPEEKWAMLLAQSGQVLEDSGLGATPEIRTNYREKADNVLTAFNGSCSQVLRHGAWKHSCEVQEFLLKFTQEVKDKEKYWRDLIQKDFRENKELDQAYHWFENAEGIVKCIELFGLSKEKIFVRVEQAILSEFSRTGFENFATFAKNSKKLIDLLGIPEGKIQKTFHEKVSHFVEEYPVYCMNAAKNMGFSLEPWKEFLHVAANKLILEANKKECSCERESRIRNACNIYEMLKKDLGDPRGDALLALWQNKTAENAERDFLIQASKIMKFKYKPVDRTEKIGLWLGRIP